MNHLPSVMPVVAAVLCASWAVAQDQPQNLAPNPSIEQGGQFGPVGWQQRPAPGSNSRFEWVEGVGHSGDHSLLIESEREYTVPDRWRAGADRSIGLQPGTEATLSAWVKTEGATGTAHVQIYVMGPPAPGDQRPAILAQPTGGSVSGTTDWTQISLTLTVPDGPSYVMAYLGLRGAGKAWFDDVRLEGVLAPPMPSQATYQADHFEELTDYEVAHRAGQTVLQIPTESEQTRGEATVPFYEPTSGWDVVLRYFDEPDGARPDTGDGCPRRWF